MTTGANTKTLVAYFSATGNTAWLAKTAAEALGADLAEIIPAQLYTPADLDWHDKKSRSSVECNDPLSRPAIKEKIGTADYDTVIIAFPIWWYNAPKIIYTFAESADLSEKKVVPICTSGGSGLGRTGSDLQKISSAGADYRKGNTFSPSVSAAELKQFFGSVLK
ncbi:MAG: NAD(P)H-dependent oxidoreductase [Bacteroides sp.]|nr:NAD(P)H-dependent oxidoreductase [Prevotella sp.]MCM1408901.1 NAD(P)H-dependent oxidoreductase [Treponema brennaborense]MCM1470828.1 NAD(P)H-dependent oxidoreductase [Bacteroides sp.]